jgi:choline-sulfatase
MKPNVLIIMTEQHRWDMMSCTGNHDVLTPNLNRIAERGIRFNQAYCPYPLCLASRSSLLTGLYAHNTNATGNKDRLDWRYRTIANHFTANG